MFYELDGAINVYTMDRHGRQRLDRLWTLVAVAVVTAVVMTALFARRQRARPVGERSPLL
jgi:hypothetical protein